MKLDDKEIKKAVDAFVPPMTESYTKMISDTVLELKARNTSCSRQKRRLWKPVSAAAAVIAVLLIAASVVFAARPALAAEVPGIGSIVYAVSPKKNGKRCRSGAYRSPVKRCFPFAFFLRSASGTDQCDLGVFHP